MKNPNFKQNKMKTKGKGLAVALVVMILVAMPALASLNNSSNSSVNENESLNITTPVPETPTPPIAESNNNTTSTDTDTDTEANANEIIDDEISIPLLSENLKFIGEDSFSANETPEFVIEIEQAFIDAVANADGEPVDVQISVKGCNGSRIGLFVEEIYSNKFKVTIPNNKTGGITPGIYTLVVEVGGQSVEHSFKWGVETEPTYDTEPIDYDSTSTLKPVIIMFKDKPDSDLVKQYGGKIKSKYHIKPALAASLSQKAIDELRKNPKIEFVVDDLQIFTMGEGEKLDWGVDRIDADVVQESNNNGTGINVAIMDTGIDYNHPDLAANYAGGYDFGGNYSGAPNDADPMDFDGHGTHCAGIVAAVKGNGIGVIGVAPEVDLYAVKVFTDDGYGRYSDVVEALEWCIDTRTDDDPDNDIQVISMSFGSAYSDGDPGIESWINAAFDAGILLVGAAGNEGNAAGVGDNVIYPARYESVIAVAATDSSDNRASFSSTGPDVELAAPGVNIYSTYLDSGYAAMSGTSMACPHVTGTAALVWNAYPEYTNTEVRQRLQATAEDLGDPGKDNKFGYGLVDAEKATYSPADTTPPASVKDLKSSAVGGTWINWTWTDPADADFSHVIVHLNGIHKNNVSKGLRFYNVTSLEPYTSYEISTQTVDTAGNVNETWVNCTAETNGEGDPLPQGDGDPTVNATANAIGTSDTTGDTLSDLQADDVSGDSPTKVVTDDGWYTIDQGDVMFIDGFDTTGISGVITDVVLTVQYSVESGYGGSNPVKWALDGQTLASTGITPTDGEVDKVATYDLYAQGVDTIDEISTLDIEFTNNDPPGPDAVSFDYVFITVTYDNPPMVATPQTYDNVTLAPKTAFERSEGMFINVSVTDADGSSNLATALITILNTTGVAIVNNDTMIQDYSIENGYVYNYSWTVPSNADLGTWTINVYANDTSDVWGSNSTTFEVKDLKAPQWSNPQTNKTTIYENDYVRFTANWTDDVALAGYIFSINQTGGWKNSSFVPFSGTFNVSENVTRITAPAGTEVQWRFYANDTSDNWNVTDIQSFVVATPPPPPSTPYMIYGRVFYKNGTACNNFTVNITNMNNSKEWGAETRTGYNYYRCILANGTDLNASEILRFDVRDSSGVQFKIFNHSVNETEVNNGGVFNFNITLEAPVTPFMIYGWVNYSNGTACNGPTVNITNTNASITWQAETNASYNYFQLILDTTNISTGNVLSFNATDGSQYSVTNHTVTQSDINNGGLFNFNLTLPAADTTPPEWRSQGQNVSQIPVGGSILLYAQGKDTVALDYAVLATNETGTWHNWTNKYGSPMDMQDATDTWKWSNFTWQNSSISAGTTVGWRIWYNDTANNWNKTDIMCFEVIAGAAPTVDSITITPDDSVEDGVQINPIPGANKTVNISAVVSDANGWDDINTVAAVITGPDTVADSPVTLNLVSHDTTTATFNGTFNMSFYYANGTYTVNVTATDMSNLTGSNSTTFDYQTAIALELDANIINFSSNGPINPGEMREVLGDENMSTLNNATIRNIGNVIIDVYVSGTNMTSNGNVIANNNIGVRIDNIPGDYYDMSVERFFDVNMSAGELSLENVDFKLFVPYGTPQGDYSGTITLTAVQS